MPLAPPFSTFVAACHAVSASSLPSVGSSPQAYPVRIEVDLRKKTYSLDASVFSSLARVAMPQVYLVERPDHVITINMATAVYTDHVVFDSAPGAQATFAGKCYIAEVPNPPTSPPGN